MNDKRFTMIYFESDGNLIFDENKRDGDEWYNSVDCLKDNEILDLLNELVEENKQLKAYKNSVHDVLLSYMDKNLTKEQSEVIIGICEELNIGWMTLDDVM